MALVEEVAAVGGAGGGGGSGGGRACGPEDPEALLNEWLGELTILTAGLQNAPNSPVNTLRPLEIAAPRIDTYGFSMANMEETQDADLDAILGELCALDSEYDEELSRLSAGYSPNYKHVKENGGSSEGAGQNRRAAELCAGAPPAGAIPRTHSPDNDSAFSDTVSMLSGESSASSAASAKCKVLKLNLHQEQKDPSFQQKADKIKLALERMREANVKKLFIKAFSTDGSSKSLLVDEKMNCGYVTRLLADKNHVTMEPRWALVEQLPDLHMERVYEDHEHLVDNLMLWTRESKNKILFAERPEKIVLFQTPEKFLLPEDDRGHWSEQDEHSRLVIIEEFFGSSGGASVPPSVSGHPVPSVEGPLYLKSDAKKGWKKYHFVLRPSGLYYFPKEKVKTLKELVCLATFDNNEVYLGISWRKKYKSPTDFCFAIKHPRLQQPKSVKFIKFLCADDQQSLERWMVAMRIAKHGRRLLENHRSLVEELAQDDLDHLAHARSCSISSIPTKSIGSSELQTNSPASQVTSSAASVAHSDISSGRHSRASSSSSSGCQSDGGTASESTFDCEFPMGTIKRKPSMKPNIPLTWMTRQLKEMAEKVAGMEDDEAEGSGECGTLTRRPRRAHQVQRTPSLTRSDDGGGTLKRQCRNNHNDPVESIYNSSIGSTATDQGPGSPSFSHYDIVLRDNRYRSTSDNGSTLYGFVGMFDSPTDTTNHIEELPLPPLPNELEVSENCAMFSSTLSLDSLPPPPPPPEPVLEDLCGSQLSLPPPPPLHTLEATSGRLHDIVNQLAAQQVASAPSALRARPFRSVTVPRQPSLDSMSSGGSDNPSLAYGACLLELQSKKLTGSPAAQIKHDREERKLERGGSIKKVAFAEDIECRSESFKNNKKILFASNGDSNDCRPCSPRKPPPPRRNDSTRLSSPKKLADSESNPPTEFLEDLQRVMRKKWQVAQKCKSDVTTTPHEVLGFREYPLHTDYKEASVSMWVQEHYGGGGEQGGARRARPPPPAPPRRSDSTHLTRTGTPLHQAT